MQTDPETDQSPSRQTAPTEAPKPVTVKQRGKKGLVPTSIYIAPPPPTIPLKTPSKPNAVANSRLMDQAIEDAEKGGYISNQVYATLDNTDKKVASLKRSLGVPPPPLVFPATVPPAARHPELDPVAFLIGAGMAVICLYGIYKLYGVMKAGVIPKLVKGAAEIKKEIPDVGEYLSE